MTEKTMTPAEQHDRYSQEDIRLALALMDPIPPETDMTLDTPPIADAAGFTQPERYDITFDDIIEFLGRFDCVTEEAIAKLKTMTYLEVAKIYEELWVLDKEANI